MSAEMDSLVFPQPAPKPLILPRRLSLHGGTTRGQRHWYPGTGPHSPSSPDKEDSIHYYYFPTTTTAATATQSSPDQQQQQHPPTLFTFGGNSDSNGEAAAAGAAVHAGYRKPNRRHSVSNGSPWTTVPPRHALHMPVMKIDPTVWRSEHHQREIYRLMHEGREEQVMRRRSIRNVMDTMTEEDEDERPSLLGNSSNNNANDNMSGVVQTVDFANSIKAATDEREKELVREQVRQEWAKFVEEQAKEYEQLLQQAAATAAADESRRRNSWPKQLSQQQVQFKMPSNVLHPIVDYPQQHYHHHQPAQLPPPGVQQGPSNNTNMGMGMGMGMGMHAGGAGMMTTGPLSNPAAWSAAPPPPFGVDTRRPSFAVHRG
ncbi:hypothetical protein B0O80DRAFT_482543 [Mortierella sp. GBAus27b]|nr:hypothetical protein BGX31_001310 [Mortierella sp. GBA43]KAI8363470.1 hypothetical protein B0O80DRAFT_482543 [Mortierella sp. GBAus27b]